MCVLHRLVQPDGTRALSLTLQIPFECVAGWNTFDCHPTGVDVLDNLHFVNWTLSLGSASLVLLLR